MTPICLRATFETGIPATLEGVDGICQRIRAFLCGADTAARFFDVTLVAREALVNAVLHGCGGDRRKQVRFFMGLSDEAIVMEIEDPGNGFDWRKQMDVKAGWVDTGGRGLSILAAYCQHYEYNEKGNKIRLFQPLAR